MAADFSTIVWWWFVLFLLGLGFFPLTAYFFRNFIDRGYPFAKIVAVLLVTYAFFLGANFKLLTLTLPSLGIILIVTLLPSLYIYKKYQKDSLWDFVKTNGLLLVFEEVLFFAAVTIWSYIRGFAPEIHGLEKFMDFGFVNSILSGKSLPPLDMWLTQAPDFSGHFINYYYFGHLYSAILTRLTSIDSGITYNLLIGTLCAFTVIGSFSIGVNLFALFKPENTVKLKTLVAIGVITAFLVALGGNLHTIYLFTKGYPNDHPVPFWQIMDGYNPNAYWYPNATRFIPNTIHEFPIYSFVVSDLHGHVLDIPFVLLTLALLFSLISPNSKFQTLNSKQNQNSNAQNPKQFSFRILFLGLILSVMYMTNAWDGLIYLVLAGLVLLYRNQQSTTSWDFFYKTVKEGLFLAVVFFIFSVPFSINFKPFVHGIGVVCPPAFLAKIKTVGPLLFEDPATHCDRSPLWMLFVLWGFFFYNILGFLLFIIIPKLRKSSPNSHLPTPISQLLIHNLHPTDVFVSLVMLVSMVLLIFPEFFYAKDIYPLHYRANTMFKLGYQAFMMLQIASVYTFFRILFDQKQEMVKTAAKRLVTVLWIVGFFIGFYLVGIYPYFAINSYYGGLKVYKGLDGMVWMKDQFPDDYAAILWLRQQIETGQLSTLPTANSQQPTASSVILEAVGESYTDYARVSAYTGLPTVVGWPVHEWLWRGSYDEAGKRIPFVETMYTSHDPQEVNTLLKKYNVSFIFVGALERQKYPRLTEDVFKELGEVMFENGSTRIYKLNEQ